MIGQDRCESTTSFLAKVSPNNATNECTHEGNGYHYLTNNHASHSGAYRAYCHH